MAKIKEFLTKYHLSIIVLFIGIALIIASFIVPPVGIIDNSVIAAVGEIFSFTAVICGLSKWGEISKVKYSNKEEN